MGQDHWSNLRNLVLVAGHAVYIAPTFDHPEADANWALQDFQKGEGRFYIEHIHTGIELANRDNESLLLFSGGQTNELAGPRPEAQSYWLLAEHFNWWNCASVKLRTSTEEFARDSFENLLFGICRFYECTRRYPERVTIVSWAFKKERFDCHRIAIGFPQDRFAFVGANNPVDLDTAMKGERRALTEFKEDPFGGNDSPGRLGDKRKKRNPFHRQHGYLASCPSEIGALLQFRSDRIAYHGPLPW